MVIKSSKKAQSVVEYLFILGLISILALASLHFVGSRVNRSVEQKPTEQTQVSETEKLEVDSCSEIGGNWDSEAKVCAPN